MSLEVFNGHWLFCSARISIVGNDANSGRWGHFSAPTLTGPGGCYGSLAAAILTVVLVYGWVVYDGDVSYGRLTAIEVPDQF